MVEKLKQITFGAAVNVTGRLVESKGPGQDVELVVEGGVEVVGRCDPDTYPLQLHHSSSPSSVSSSVTPGAHSSSGIPSSSGPHSSSGAHSAEYLREHLHLRLRTPGMQHTMRLRAKVKEALEGYLTGEQEFVYVHTPVITGIDAEGGGESFRVGRIGKENTNREAGKEEEEEEFFGRPAHLTVSSQLHLEAFQAALGRVYTLAPCFRAERSMTGRHLAEFWMLECEWGGVGDIIGMDGAREGLVSPSSSSRDLHGLCTFVEDMLRYTIARVLPNTDNEVAQAAFSQKPWPRITYTEAIRILQQAQPLFTYPPILGHSLQSEHEKYLAEVVFNGPVFVMDYPRGVKPFYMRVNGDKKNMETVACFDLLVPRVGELVGGSVREERYEVLRMSMVEAGLISSPSPSSPSSPSPSSPLSLSSPSSPSSPLFPSSPSSSPSPTSPSSKKPPQNPYEWYLDLRRHGSVPHGGFGMGFERLIMWLGVGNIRESVGMPRWKGWMGM
ncbi:uncharacterized protein C8R40DRAFT_1150610 [Lentinula edodes]|uniref:uncharacterized protein n=1 Tax=Lentinula edodes TaxID=5353 RepID=UPI001E8EDCD6|nr:uncharacterized protein C8R40DRAFT_1150610 [Lentinula edodes]KAH7873036.1 hypothetical protein C8R40DRAFT_1150610 [Lentinula edodes]